MDKQVEIDNEKTKKLRLTSAIIAAVTGVVWFIYDFIPVANKGRGDTISEVIRDFGRYAWSLHFFFGSLISHFSINLGQYDNYQTLFFIWVGILLSLIGANLFTYFYLDYQAQNWVRIISLFLGLVAGTFLWGQNP